MEHIYPGIHKLDNLYSAFAKVRKNKGIAGIDGVSIDFFSLSLDKNIHAIQGLLETEAYLPQPLLRLHINKENGKIRNLSIPTVRDRLVQKALLNILTPIVDPNFRASSFAYRKGKSVGEANSQMKRYIGEGFRWIIKSDIESFFDSIDQKIMVEKLSQVIDEEKVLNLINGWLKADAYDGLTIIRPHEGLPQGSPISPLLANLYLNEFDKAMETKDCRAIRYGDDFAVLCKDPSSAGDMLDYVRNFLANMHLSLNTGKTWISEFDDGFKFLGKVFTKNHVLNPSIEPESEEPESEDKTTPKVSKCGATSCTSLMRTLYVQEQRAVLRKDHARIAITKEKDVLLKVPSTKVDQIIVLGNCTITVPLMKYCLKRSIPITLLSNTGDYYGRIESPNSTNIELQRQQLLKSLDPVFSLNTSKAIVKGKIANSKVLLQRHNRKIHSDDIEKTIGLFDELLRKIPEIETLAQLRGIEGIAAANYFKVFRFLLKNELGFAKRIKHPPKDPVNSLLSFGYTLLFNNIYSFLNVYGLSPYLGYFHQNKGRHPVLVSDMIEEFRAPVVDSLVIYLVNSSLIKESDFHDKNQGNGVCLLTDEARKVFIKQFENRMCTKITHPTTGLLANWRQCIELQVKEMVNYLQGKINNYRPILVRY